MIDINKNLNTIWNELLIQYSEINLLGLFALGKINYGFEPDNTIDVICVYLPTFTELCTTEPKTEYKEFVIDNISYILKIVDIRKMYNIELIKDTVALEMLFCNTKYLNPNYILTFENYFILKRETIARYNPRLRMQKAYDRAAAALMEANYFEAMRLCISANLYLTHSCDECFHFTEMSNNMLLQAVIDGKIEVYDDEILESIQKCIDHYPEETSIVASAEIKEGVVALMNSSLKRNVRNDSFVETLTNKEKEALKSILKALDNGEGNISITSLLTETKISRPVFNNVLQKIKENNIGEITNKGAKGMYIKIANIANLEKELE